MTILNLQSITFFKTEAAARRLADANNNNADDEDCSYAVETWERGFVITVHDEDGRYLGTL